MQWEMVLSYFRKPHKVLINVNMKWLEWCGLFNTAKKDLSAGEVNGHVVVKNLFTTDYSVFKYLAWRLPHCETSFHSTCTCTSRRSAAKFKTIRRQVLQPKDGQWRREDRKDDREIYGSEIRLRQHEAEESAEKYFPAAFEWVSLMGSSGKLAFYWREVGRLSKKFPGPSKYEICLVLEKKLMTDPFKGVLWKSTAYLNAPLNFWVSHHSTSQSR